MRVEAPTRRDLVLTAAAGLLVAGCGGEEEQATAPAAGLGAGDTGIVAFALSLEVLERDLYREIARSGPFRGAERTLAQRLGEVEAEHAEVLAGILRRERTPEPAKIEADLERLVSVGRTELIRLLVEIEDLGANAYLGAAPTIVDRDALALGLSIHSVEARHAVIWRSRLNLRSSPDGAFAAPVNPGEVATRLGELLA